MKAIYLFLTAIPLVGIARPAAAQETPAVETRRFDASAYAGWFNANKSGLNTWDDWYSRSWHGSLSAGYYWTDHLKTELDFSGTSRGTVYGRPLAIQTPEGPTPDHVRYEFSTHSLTLVQHYQFLRNAWFHPTLGGGVALTWETERRHYPPVYVSDRSGRYTTSRLVQPERTEGPDTTLRAGALAAAGFKAYMSERAFFRSDVRAIFTGRVEHVTVRMGFGVDF